MSIEESLSPDPPHRLATTRFVLLAGLVAATTLLSLVKLRETGMPDPAQLRAAVEGFGLWAPVGYILMLALRPFLFLPGPPLMMAGGLAFGAWNGTLLTTGGLILGALTTYALARGLGHDFVRARTGHRLDGVNRGRLGPGLVFLMNLMPVFPLSIPNYGAGLAGMRLVPFTLATGLGLAPRVLVWSTLGSLLVQMNRAYLAGASVALLALLAIPLYWRVAQADSLSGPALPAADRPSAVAGSSDRST